MGTYPPLGDADEQVADHEEKGNPHPDSASATDISNHADNDGAHHAQTAAGDGLGFDSTNAVVYALLGQGVNLDANGRIQTPLGNALGIDANGRIYVEEGNVSYGNLSGTPNSTESGGSGSSEDTVWTGNTDTADNPVSANFTESETHAVNMYFDNQSGSAYGRDVVLYDPLDGSEIHREGISVPDGQNWVRVNFPIVRADSITVETGAGASIFLQEIRIARGFVPNHGHSI